MESGCLVPHPDSPNFHEASWQQKWKEIYTCTDLTLNISAQFHELQFRSLWGRSSDSIGNFKILWEFVFCLVWFILFFFLFLFVCVCLFWFGGWVWFWLYFGFLLLFFVLDRKRLKGLWLKRSSFNEKIHFRAIIFFFFCLLEAIWQKIPESVLLTV